MAHVAARLRSTLASARREWRGEPRAEAPRLDLNHAFPGGAKVRVQSESDWWVYNEVFVDREYDDAIRLALHRSSADRGMFVLDVGANVGYFSARILEQAKEVGFPAPAIEVLMVEGSPTVHADLESRYRDNPLPEIRTSIVHGLVGQRTGEGEMLEIAFGARNTLRPEHNAALSHAFETKKLRVPFVDLMAQVAPHARIDLFKCDVEGSEQAVLESYATDLLPLVQVAVFEFHHELCDIPRCRSLLNDAGLEQTVVSATTETTTLEVFARP